MKYKLFLLSILLPLHIFACKCAYTPAIKNSFDEASFVFIGEIYDVVEVPNGYKTAQDILSKVKITTIYKSNNYNDFYNENATLFHSPNNSCDVAFSEKGKYLIFAYIDENNGLLYSSHCFVQKRWDQVTSEELKELQKLSTDYQRALTKPNTSTEIVEIIDTSFEVTNPVIKKLKKELSDLTIENERLKMIVYSLGATLLLLIIILFLRRKVNLLKNK
ncbi:hypothetical protein [Chryseobacterium sp. c4a]|uniref:hypothetical protein n=1 Tax=Chryseobacterium sp. c4a TaxID=1573582 RepID=UPI001359712F|nr:hypothetical protein [Chryseobacterium sp. c4a]